MKKLINITLLSLLLLNLVSCGKESSSHSSKDFYELSPEDGACINYIFTSKDASKLSPISPPNESVKEGKCPSNYNFQCGTVKQENFSAINNKLAQEGVQLSALVKTLDEGYCRNL